MLEPSHLRVLIVRLGAMGDILHALPAASALRRARPGWHIGWAVEPQWMPLLRASAEAAPRSPAQPLLDVLHAVPAKSWARRPLALSTIRAVRALGAELRGARYDVVLDLQGAVRSALLGRLARPGRLIGEEAPREAPARFLYPERAATRGVHVIEQAAEIVSALLPLEGPIELPLLPRDGDAERWCDAAGLYRDETPRILLHPGAGWGAKRWPPERYAEAGALLARETGAQILVHAAPGELALGQAVAARLRELRVGALLFTPTLGQLIEATRRSTLAIGGDTGPLHLAAALGLPTVGIYGPTDPARNGPFHGRFRILRDPASRRDHTRHAAPEAGLLRISPEAAVEAALALLRGQVPGELGAARQAYARAGAPA